MRPVRNDMRTLWERIAERPLSAKIVAGIILAGIFSLMVSPDVLDHGKAAATSLTRSASPGAGRTDAGSTMDPNGDCSPNRHHAPEAGP
jgi:hypothetical protein